MMAAANAVLIGWNMRGVWRRGARTRLPRVEDPSNHKDAQGILNRTATDAM
jgi:hypothetical protein